MKQYKVIVVVVFMICFSLLTFVSQGEEWAEEVSATQDDDIAWVAMASDQSVVETARVVAASELTEESIKPTPEVHGPVYGSNEVIVTHNDAISFDEIPVPLDPRIQQIVEATPLDEATTMIILEYADLYELRVALVLGLMDLESNFSQYLVGTSQDRGYMQIIPGTEKWLAQDFGKELGLTYDTSRIFDANYNIPLGMKYLSILQNQYGNETKMLTSYNRGDFGMEKWFKANGTYETTYSRVVLKRAAKYTYIK